MTPLSRDQSVLCATAWSTQGATLSNPTSPAHFAPQYGLPMWGRISNPIYSMPLSNNTIVPQEATHDQRYDQKQGANVIEEGMRMLHVGAALNGSNIVPMVKKEKIINLFQKRYKDNRKRVSEKKELKNCCQKNDESYSGFTKRWKEKVAQTLDRPTKDDGIDMFLKNIKPFYFHKIICWGYANFDTLVAAYSRIEERLYLGIMKEYCHCKGKESDINVDEMDLADMVSNIGQNEYGQMSFNYSNEHVNVLGNVECKRGKSGKREHKRRHNDELPMPKPTSSKN